MYSAVQCCTWAYGDVHTSTCVRSECVAIRSVNGLYSFASTYGAVCYTRVMQAVQGPKHVSYLTDVISRDKFQPYH